MRRTLFSLLLLAAVAAAQGVDEWIEQVLDPRTSPEQRVDALKRVGQSKEGLDKLAEKGLDGRRDTEVVHAVVDTLLKAADYRPYIDRICRLLLVEKHRDKVLRRLQVVGEHPERGQPLLDGLGAIAREATDSAMREAAILALGKIPRRAAAQIIVDAGLGATDERVRGAVEAYVRRLFPVESVKEAKDYLDSHRLDSFWDLVQGRIDQLIAVQKEQEERVRDYLRKASPADALEVFEEGGGNRVFAAERLRELAEQNAVPEPAGFARALVDRALTQELAREPPDAKVLAELLGALYPYAKDAASPLWQVKQPKEVRDLIQRLADLPGNGPDHERFGRDAVRLLGAIDDEGLAINAFAENFSSVDVRKEALQQLGALAGRLRARQNYVGIKLAGLLAKNKGEPVLRAQILSLLTQNHVPVAREPDVVAVLRGFLDKGATPDLSDAELRDCTFVLGKSRTPEAKEALLKAAAGHRDLKVRRFAVEEALLPWARVDPEIHEAFKGLALAAERSGPLTGRSAALLRRPPGSDVGARGNARSERETSDPALDGSATQCARVSPPVHDRSLNATPVPSGTSSRPRVSAVLACTNTVFASTAPRGCGKSMSTGPCSRSRCDVAAPTPCKLDRGPSPPCGDVP